MIHLSATVIQSMRIFLQACKKAVQALKAGILWVRKLSVLCYSLFDMLEAFVIFDVILSDHYNCELI